MATPPPEGESCVCIYVRDEKKLEQKKGVYLVTTTVPSTLIGQLRLKPLLSVAIPVLSKKVKLSVY
jgi:hypothetical protein